MRSIPFAALACALLALAPAAGAQGSAGPALATTVGDPIAYTISLPKQWDVQRDGDKLIAVGPDALVLVGATDLVTERKETLALSDAESRRIFSNLIMGSDSLLFGLLSLGVRNAAAAADFSDIVQEMDSLGGQRAAVMRGRMVSGGVPARFEMRVTVKDGIMYGLFMATAYDGRRANEPLLGRIRESFVLAPAPR